MLIIYIIFLEPSTGAILTMEYDVTTFNMAFFNKMIHDTYHVHDSPTTTNVNISVNPDFSNKCEFI